MKKIAAFAGIAVMTASTLIFPVQSHAEEAFVPMEASQPPMPTIALAEQKNAKPSPVVPKESTSNFLLANSLSAAEDSPFIVEAEQLDADGKIYSVKTYQKKSDNTKGELLSHIKQEELAENEYRITSYNVSTSAIEWIGDQKVLSSAVFELKKYYVYPDGSRGDILEHVRIENLGNSTTRVTMFNSWGWGDKSIFSIAEYKQLSANKTEIKHFDVNYDGSKGSLIFWGTQEELGENHTMHAHYNLTTGKPEIYLEQKRLSEQKWDLKNYAVNANGTRGLMTAHFTQEDFGRYIEVVDFDPVTGRTLGISQQEYINGYEEYRTYAVNANGTRGALLARSRHMPLPDGFTNVTTFNAAGQVISITDQRDISANKNEIKLYEIRPDGSQGIVLQHTFQETLPNGVIKVSVLNNGAIVDIFSQTATAEGVLITRYDIVTGKVVSHFEYIWRGGEEYEIKRYAVRADGSKGALNLRLVQEKLDSNTVRITNLNLTTGAVTKISEQTVLSPVKTEIRNYALNSDGTQGALQSRYTEERLGPDHTIFTIFAVNTGAVASITEQKLLAKDNYEFKLYSVNADGSRGPATRHFRQAKIGTNQWLITDMDIMTGKVVKIIEQKWLTTNDVITELKQYSVKADGTKGALISYVVQERLATNHHQFTIYHPSTLKVKEIYEQKITGTARTEFTYYLLNADGTKGAFKEKVVQQQIDTDTKVPGIQGARFSVKKYDANGVLKSNILQEQLTPTTYKVTTYDVVTGKILTTKTVTGNTWPVPMRENRPVETIRAIRAVTPPPHAFAPTQQLIETSAAHLVYEVAILRLYEMVEIYKP